MGEREKCGQYGTRVLQMLVVLVHYVKEKEINFKLILEEYIKMHDIVGLASQSLVGLCHGSPIFLNSLKDWLRLGLDPCIGYIPSI